MYRTLMTLILVAGCAPPPVPPPAVGLPKNCRQVIVVKPKGATPHVEVTCFEQRAGQWGPVLTAIPGTAGRNGIAALGQKREGDDRTPSGVYAIGPAFGYAEKIATGLDYFRATDNDFWIDDPKSPDYNRRVTGAKPTVSHEVLRRSDPFYMLAAVIQYNTDPVVPGAGSAIFLHIWSGPDGPTAGCVAMAEADLARVLQWLDRASNPVITIEG